DIIAPDLRKPLAGFTPDSGIVVNQHRIEVAVNNTEGNPESRHFLFTINKLDTASLMYIFDDITESHLREKQLNQSLLDKAVEQSKFEIASGVLHDIGNAVVGFGTHTSRIRSLIEQNETGMLEKLKLFVEKNKTALFSALGDARGQAVIDLLDGVITNEKKQIGDIRNSIADQQHIISHIQEILNIQRQYVSGQSAERLPVNLRSVIQDAYSMLQGTMEKKGIAFQLEAPVLSPKIKGDRTQLMQVFLNLLKNSMEAFSNSDINEKNIRVHLASADEMIRVTVEDNGMGFDEVTGSGLLTRGFTTKQEGSGLGLVNCKKIIESHNGSFSITSDGPGKGARSEIIFYQQT
ncbi:MAG: HAMP domain-containing histidine kinase, partial [Bacteroidota bacterium]|nr:HAMP domain-containing histidine kinase [Bacteroidota bacterium]